MTYNTHDLGDLVRVQSEFTNQLTEDAIDPEVVKLSIRTPAGVVTTYTYNDDPEIVKDAVGEYHMDVDADEDGEWSYRFFSTGTGQAAEEKRFRVRPAKAI